MKGYATIELLILSNIFMTLAWYGHLKFKGLKWFENAGLITIVLISWRLALFEYCFASPIRAKLSGRVPANRIGYEGNGGPFSLVQLKVIQEVIPWSFLLVSLYYFSKTKPLDRIISLALYS
jgi:hypothetical protein